MSAAIERKRGPSNNEAIRSQACGGGGRSGRRARPGRASRSRRVGPALPLPPRRPRVPLPPRSAGRATPASAPPTAKSRAMTVGLNPGPGSSGRTWVDPSSRALASWLHYPATGAVPLPQCTRVGRMSSRTPIPGRCWPPRTRTGCSRPASTLKVHHRGRADPAAEPEHHRRWPPRRRPRPRSTTWASSPDRRYKVSDLFNALLLISANDAAVNPDPGDGIAGQGHGADQRRGTPPAGLRRRGPRCRTACPRTAR